MRDLQQDETAAAGNPIPQGPRHLALKKSAERRRRSQPAHGLRACKAIKQHLYLCNDNNKRRSAGSDAMGPTRDLRDCLVSRKSINKY